MQGLHARMHMSTTSRMISFRCVAPACRVVDQKPWQFHRFGVFRWKCPLVIIFNRGFPWWKTPLVGIHHFAAVFFSWKVHGEPCGSPAGKQFTSSKSRGAAFQHLWLVLINCASPGVNPYGHTHRIVSRGVPHSIFRKGGGDTR